METLVEKAEKFAEKAHKGQLRKDGVTPYIEHPKAIVEILKEIGIIDEDVLSAAWLHDVVEDSDTPIVTIRVEFGANIAWMVYVLTRNIDNVGYKQRLSIAESEIQKIKLADFAHNCRSLEYSSKETAERYVKEAGEFYIPLAKELFLKQLYEDIEKSIARFKSLSR